MSIFHIFPLLFSLALCQYSQFPSIQYNGNPPGMNLNKYVENVEIPPEVFECSSPFYQPDSSNLWNYTQIARAFYEYGIKPWNFPNPTNPFAHIGDCVAALIIAAGECSPPADTTKKGCTTQSGPSGVFQTDFLRTVPGFPFAPVMNLCLSAYGAGYMAAPWLAAPQKTCTISVKGNGPASMYNCYLAKSTVNEYGSNCKDPRSIVNTKYNNFIGPFCHKSGASRWSLCSSCCTLFNGGGNSYQNPFPQYYFEKAVEQGAENFENICRLAAYMR